MAGQPLPKLHVRVVGTSASPTWRQHDSDRRDVRFVGSDLLVRTAAQAAASPARPAHKFPQKPLPLRPQFIYTVARDRPAPASCDSLREL